MKISRPFCRITNTFLLASFLLAFLAVQPAKTEATVIHIKSDGSIQPSTVPISSIDNMTYMFTDNITGLIFVERSNIIIDGNASALLGGGTGAGFTLYYPTNVTIKNTNIMHFSYGIYMDGPSKITIIGNNITNNSYGINFYRCSHNTIYGNVIAHNNIGIFISYSSKNNTVEANAITWNAQGGVGVWAGSNGNRILRNEISGNILQNYAYGIMLSYASNASIFYNDLRNNYNNIIIANHSVYNVIMENNIADSIIYGIYLYGRTSEISIAKNNITGSDAYGISLRLSYNCTIYKNNIMNNTEGVALFHLGANNTFYFNNFAGNGNHVVFNANISNMWDNGFVGNYWDNYTSSDANGDGIGDTPYVINPINIDHYPLMNPYRPLRGDLNEDDKVDGKDLAIVVQAFGSYPGYQRWNSQADLNRDNRIDGKDVVIVAANWGKKFP